MEFQTPYYIINQKELDANYKKLIEALESNWNNYIVGYSYKTNSLPWVIAYFKKRGCYAEVVSKEEYDLAKYIGVDKKKIIYNGPIKSKDTFIEAIQNGCIVNIDSQREIDWLDDVTKPNIKVGIRVNFDIEKMCPGQSQCGDEGGRFGFCFENGELELAINKIQMKNIDICGLHLHTSSKTRGIEIYKAIAKTACEVAKRYKLRLSFVDVGGGFYGGLLNKPQYDEYIFEMSKILKQQFVPETTTLIVEPGMALVGSPISYVTTVLDVKETSFNRFVITDGTRTDIDPLMTKKTYFYSFTKKNETNKVKKQVICGYTCMENDRLFVAYNESALNVGDVIKYDKVGAYTMCLTPLFIKYFPDVYVDNGEKTFKVRTAWEIEEYIQKSRFEE